jgi:transposase
VRGCARGSTLVAYWTGRSANGAYIGLTTRRHASREIDWSGRISKCRDPLLRSYLFEAARVLLTRVPKWSAQRLGA